MCKKGHNLNKVTVGEQESGSGFKYHDCDGCQIEVRSFENVFRCEVCNFDLCLKCFTSRQIDSAKTEQVAKKDKFMERQQVLRRGLHEMRMKEARKEGVPRQSGDHIYSADFFDSLPAAEKGSLKSDGKRRRREMKGQTKIGVPPAHPPLFPQD
jgi:hypothetical protein